MKETQQGGVTYPLEFLMVQSSDHITGATGLTPTVTLSKNGAAFAAPAGTVSEVGNGWYKIAGAGLATDTDTLGPLLIHATSAGADPSDTLYNVVPWNPFSAVSATLSTLERDALANELLDLANSIESGETLRQTIRLLRAVLVGQSAESNGTIVFKRRDGSTTALTVVHDQVGSRSSSVVGTV